MSIFTNRFLILAAAGLFYSNSGMSGPFDPSEYLLKKELSKGVLTLTDVTIFKVDGHRYKQFNASNGAVLLPSETEMPIVREPRALCSYHLKAFQEVLKIREHVLIAREVKKLHSKEILRLVGKCIEGTLKGPEIKVTTRDGLEVQMTPKKKTPEKIEK